MKNRLHDFKIREGEFIFCEGEKYFLRYENRFHTFFKFCINPKLTK